MAEAIISAAGDGYGLAISHSGTLPIAGQSGGTYYTLLTDTAGKLVTAGAGGGYAGSDVTVVAGSIQPYGQLGSVEVWQDTASDLNILGSVGITTSPVPVSGAMKNLGGSFAITTTPLPVSGTSLLVSGAGVFSILGSVGISTSPIPVSGAEITTRGYPTKDIIRKSSGSPAVNYVFGDISRSVLIQNLGSSPIYYTFDATANPASSGTAFMNFFDSISLDIEAGSASIQGSGVTSPECQVIALR